MTRILLEICVADADSFDAAIEGGADRIELCSALELGGLTPTPGLIAHAGQSPIPVRAMIRPRSGDFVWSARDCALMEIEIARMREARFDGVVLGASHVDGSLDIETLATLAAAAGPMGKTLHRAFDLVPDQREALEHAIVLGFDRILTSGGQATAVAGKSALGDIHAAAGNRITIMAGSGVTFENLPDLLADLPLREVHASGSADHPQSPAAIRLGFASQVRRATSASVVAGLRARLDVIAAGR